MCICPAPRRRAKERTASGPAQQTSIAGMNVFLPGAFAELELRPLKGLLILPGLRFDYFSDISQATWAPRLTVRYQLASRWP